MEKYKKLIALLVVFGSIHFILTSAIFPAYQKWLFNQNYDIKTLPLKSSYYFAAVQYAYVIIWMPVAIWIYKDSKKEMSAPWLWAILMLLAHYEGLIIYLLLRIIMDKEQSETTPNNCLHTDAK